MSLVRLVAMVAGLGSAVALGQVKPAPKAPQRDPPAPAEAPALKFEAGKETTVEQPGLADGHFILYVPKDYTPDRAWPLVFCYHGINQSAKVWPFKELTDGKGFIVVGMSYVTKNGGELEQEWASLLRVGQLVAGTLKVNPRMVFIGGFSRGGVWTYNLAGKNPSLFAGVVALGMSGSPGSSAAAWQGKPVLIAHGEKDEYCQNTQSTLDAFRRVGAQVTHEVFKGQGHAVDTKNEVCKKWLRDHGPLMALRADLDAARAAEKSGALGTALAVYEAIAGVEDGGEPAQAARESAKTIAEAADKLLADAEAAIGKKKYADAVKTLTGVEKRYAGSAPAGKAKARLEEIQNDPQIKAQIEQARLDAAADALEAQAQAAEKAKDFGRAMAVYEKYLAAYPSAARAAEVKARLDALKSDKSIAAAVAGKQMDKDCKAWMSMANNYLKAGMWGKARPYLERIVATYPESKYAAAAREKLEEIK